MATKTVKKKTAKRGQRDRRRPRVALVSEMQMKLNKLSAFQLEAIKLGLEELKDKIGRTGEEAMVVNFGDRVLNRVDVDEILDAINRQ